MNDAGGEFHITPTAALSATRISGKGRTKIADFDNMVRQLDAEHAAAPPRAMVVVDAARLWKGYVYNRGNSDSRGQAVDRHFLTLFGGKPFSKDNSGRKDLAEAIADSSNPLTTRAAADRIWRNLMGLSLVPAPDDMGLQSPPPSHPKLLDYLAHQFVSQKWSTKDLVRSIVMSQTYQQSCGFRADAHQADPENKLYWRRDLRRLDFEAMRDSILAAAGNLGLTPRRTGG